MTEMREKRHIMLRRALWQKGTIRFQLMRSVIHKDEALTASLSGDKNKSLDERSSDPAVSHVEMDWQGKDTTEQRCSNRVDWT